ncbi:hypothetical protein [Klebsiella phage phiKp_32]|nr:hypothetical protein [Klebsiella phage phiKp_32]
MSAGVISKNMWVSLLSKALNADASVLESQTFVFSPSSSDDLVRISDVRGPDSPVVMKKFDFGKLTYGRKFDVRHILQDSENKTADEIFDYWKKLVRLDDLDRGEVDLVKDESILYIYFKSSSICFKGSVEVTYADR